MRSLLFLGGLLVSLSSFGQVIRSQSVSNAGAVSSTNGTIVHHGYVGAPVTQGTGNATQAGFFHAILSFRPAVQASDITFPEFTSNSLTVSWTNGTGERRVVLMKANTAVDTPPANGTGYTANTVFGTGSQIGTGNYVVYDGTGSSVTVTGLSPSVVYHVKVYEYDGKYLTNNSGIIYHLNNSTNNPSSRSTLSLEPTVQPTGPLAYSDITANSMNVSFTAAAGADGYIVLRRAGSAVTDIPQDGTMPAVGSVMGNSTVAYIGVAPSFSNTGLNAATVYHYAIYAYRGSGPTINYLTTAPLTGNRSTIIGNEPTAQPTNMTFASVTETGMSVSFTAATGTPTGYIVLRRAGAAPAEVPVDGTVYSGTFGASTVVHTGSTTTFSSTGLVAGTVYHYAAFAYNGTGEQINYRSISPLAGNRTTLATEPTTQPTSLAFSDITATTMTGTFTAASGNPSGYLVLRRLGSAPTEVPVDGTTYSGTFGASTVVYSGPNTTFTSTGLQAGTIYHYAVYAYNGSGLSINYRTATPERQSIITVPDIPLNARSSEIANGTFRASWDASATALDYELEVSLNEGFTQPLANSPFVVTSTNRLFGGLSISGTFYWFRVRARNSSGYSEYSNVVDLYTPGTGETPLAINYVGQAPSSLTGTISVTASGGNGSTKTVDIHWRGITERTFTTSPMNNTGGGNWGISINSAIADVMGLEYYASVTDQTGTVVTPSNYIYQPIASGTIIPGLSFGGEIRNYRIISIPYSLSINSTPIVFSALGPYDKNKWRLIQWNGSAYLDNPTTIIPGRSYWFNARQSTTIELGVGTVVQHNQSNPYEWVLQQGWNMIGNPYPFAIDWDEVLEANGNPSTVDLDYYVFNPATVGYSPSNTLKPFEGGFVYASTNNVRLQAPVTLKSAAGGRLKSEEFFEINLDAENWQLPITAIQGEVVNNLVAVGMHKEAKFGKDRFDRVALPNFLNYVQLTTEHPTAFIPHFLRDIVPPQTNYSWNFKVVASQSGPVELKWDVNAIQNNFSQLLLYDVSSGTLLDMRTTGKYVVSTGDGAIIQIIYARSEFKNIIYELSNAYPNPFHNQVTLPGYFNATGEKTLVSIVITSLNGTEVYKHTDYINTRGLYQSEWNGETATGEPVRTGLYYYRVVYTNGQHQQTFQGKLIKL